MRYCIIKYIHYRRFIYIQNQNLFDKIIHVLQFIPIHNNVDLNVDTYNVY